MSIFHPGSTRSDDLLGSMVEDGWPDFHHCDKFLRDFHLGKIYFGSTISEVLVHGHLSTIAVTCGESANQRWKVDAGAKLLSL